MNKSLVAYTKFEFHGLHSIFLLRQFLEQYCETLKEYEMIRNTERFVLGPPCWGLPFQAETSIRDSGHENWKFVEA